MNPLGFKYPVNPTTILAVAITDQKPKAVIVAKLPHQLTGLLGYPG
jgi:hypothetical protein